MEQTEHCQVTVTAPSFEEASAIGRVAVEQRFAACAQVSGPITSTYWWDDKVTTSDEWVCVLETRTALVESLSSAIRAAHSYDVPEIIATPIHGGNPHYLAWIDAETRVDNEPSR
jgi:periplasmic divalent cation tolerance protein